MTFLIVFIAIAFLIILISAFKVNPFLAFLIVSIGAGVFLGLPLKDITRSVERGIGETVGSIVIIICLGAMLGKLVAESGAAQRIASVMMRIFGEKYIQWALLITGFIIGISLFYGVGFVLMIPLIFSVVYQYRLPAVYIGLPMIAALSVTHGFLPPHPSPTALVSQFNANLGLTLIYGLIIAIPAIIIAGPFFSRFLKGIISKPLETFKPNELPENQLPGTWNSFITALLPVILLIITTSFPFLSFETEELLSGIAFVGEPAIVMLLALLVGTFSLGVFQGKDVKDLMNIYGDAVKDVAMILLCIAGAGALKQVLTDSGVSNEIAASLKNWTIHPLVLGWLISAVIRVAVGSATVAGLTAAGIIAPVVLQSDINPNLMALSIGAGSLVLSHVNDSGFWLYKEYFNLSIKDTLKSWTAMETIVAVIGLVGVLLLDLVV